MRREFLVKLEELYKALKDLYEYAIETESEADFDRVSRVLDYAQQYAEHSQDALEAQKAGATEELRTSLMVATVYDVRALEALVEGVPAEPILSVYKRLREQLQGKSSEG